MSMIVLPCVKSLLERVERMRKINISVAINPHRTLRNILVHPKDKGEPKEGVYTIDCKNCNKKYVGGNRKTFGKRVKEHKKEEQQLTEG